MKKGLSLVTSLVLVIAAALVIAVWYVRYRVPFERQYNAARAECDLGLHAKALPVLQRAVRKYAKTPQHAGALHALARCETALDATNVARWTQVLAVHTDPQVRAEAQYHLARQAPDARAAMQVFVRDYADTPWAREFLVVLGEQAAGAGDDVAAAGWWQQLVDQHPQSDEAVRVRARLGQINMKLLCSQRPLPFTGKHIVKRGEYLSTIAKLRTNTVDQLRRLNGLRHDTIAPGVTLRLDHSVYRIAVDISDHLLTLSRVWAGTTNFVKCYSVGTGLQDNTPRGTYRIITRLEEPTWCRPGSPPVPYGSKENLLGTRWLGIDCPGYGIHGTWEPDTVGKNSSAGCIRMVNEDVEELFDMVRVGTPVIIHD
jgi:lipoprotein-anchoring transpeptidase ErfK/SrfK